jgi:Cyclophilin type peptidyl-prolyl cis-trans isomerase/CLD
MEPLSPHLNPNLIGSPKILKLPTYTTFILSLFFPSFYQFCRLDGEHVAFGRVVHGMDTVFAIEGGAGTYNGKPRKKVVIIDSGELPKTEWEDA